MPIGKNALKRVTNNGYSNVSTSAPDMENSEPIVTAETVNEKKPAKKKAEPKKSESKKTEVKAEKTETKAAPKKSASKKATKTEKAEPEAKAEVKTEARAEVTETSHPDGFVKISCGMDMPAYLL